MEADRKEKGLERPCWDCKHSDDIKNSPIKLLNNNSQVNETVVVICHSDVNATITLQSEEHPKSPTFID